ncbi:hypothetical protein E2C01_075972 [Portunus trituberculatus]|uniref:Uncharacterized protein n=1 Tax=Portunus trituberculatus TaxID=210409 RepID=A0A5B7IA56_PORTR|nr:hypothetical protein [Portunus trituberculatus]
MTSTVRLAARGCWGLGAVAVHREAVGPRDTDGGAEERQEVERRDGRKKGKRSDGSSGVNLPEEKSCSRK